jgi:hypothetical protein
MTEQRLPGGRSFGAVRAGGGGPVFQRMLPWAAELEQSGNEVTELPDEFWPGPGR